MTHTAPNPQPYQNILGKKTRAKNEPHVRLTFQQMLSRKPFMRCDLYLADLLASMKAVGWKFVIQDIPAFAEKIGLSMRTFQRARKLLTAAGKLIENRINRDSIEFFLVRDDDRLIVQDVQPIVQDVQPIVQDVQPIVIASPKPLPETEYSDPSYLSSNSFSNSLSLLEAEDEDKEERENLKPVKNGKPTPEFREWLETQARKMPKPIANIPVWILAMAKREDWRETFIEWQRLSVETKSSAALSPSSDYFVAQKTIEQTPDEKEAMKIAIAAAKSRLNVASIPESKFSRATA